MTMKRSREVLLAAIQRVRIAYGEVQWTNGYRGGRSSAGAADDDHDRKLYEREMAQHNACAAADAALTRHLAGFARVVRASARGTR